MKRAKTQSYLKHIHSSQSQAKGDHHRAYPSSSKNVLDLFMMGVTVTVTQVKAQTKVRMKAIEIYSHQWGSLNRENEKSRATPTKQICKSNNSARGKKGK